MTIHLIGEGAKEVHVDYFALVVQNLRGVCPLLEVYALFLHADGAVLGDELGYLTVQVPPGVLPADGIHGFSNPPMPACVVHLDHARMQARGANDSNVAMIGGGLVLVDELNQETTTRGAITASGVNQRQRFLL